ncbi:aspartate aminotransferase [Adhaeretor mobilis]|uniref:Aspartate aminotransferase n=1 Tax=Adhaeretor mobilis TaxID=1930276 RepID=A0A517MPQ6_9BACT|nr:aspartate aminotransferase [Adhaeretor mobilis]
MTHKIFGLKGLHGRQNTQSLQVRFYQIAFDAANLPQGGTYFLYTPSPKGLEGPGVQFANAEEASQFLIKEQSICTVPWDDAGSFLRFSVTYVAEDEAAEDALMAETEARLKSLQPVF